MNTLTHLLRPTLLAFLLSACGPSIGTLQARAQSGGVEENAPLHVRREVLIRAPREAVWRTLTDFAAWPQWQPEVSEVRTPTNLKPGATFEWKSGSYQIVSTLALVEPNARIAWTGTASMAKAIHLWRLEQASPGVTRVIDEETMDGFLLTWFYSPKDLDADVARSLERLQAAAEARVRL